MEKDFRAESMEIMPTAYVTGFIARNLLRDSTCNSLKACLLAVVGEEYSPTNAFILFNDHTSNTEHALIFPSDKLVTTVGDAADLIQEMVMNRESRLEYNLLPRVKYISSGCLMVV